jgi:hypothetical protein
MALQRREAPRVSSQLVAQTRPTRAPRRLINTLKSVGRRASREWHTACRAQVSRWERRQGSFRGSRCGPEQCGRSPTTTWRALRFSFNRPPQSTRALIFGAGAACDKDPLESAPNAHAPDVVSPEEIREAVRQVAALLRTRPPSRGRTESSVSAAQGGAVAAALRGRWRSIHAGVRVTGGGAGRACESIETRSSMASFRQPRHGCHVLSLSTLVSPKQRTAKPCPGQVRDG